MPQPYPGQQWKHGWIPLTPGAIRSKNHGRTPGPKSKLGRHLAQLQRSNRTSTSGGRSSGSGARTGAGGSPSALMDAAIRSRAAQLQARSGATNRPTQARSTTSDRVNVANRTSGDLDAAAAAIRSGDHARAVNLLTRAMNNTRDPKQRAAIKKQRDELARKLMGRGHQQQSNRRTPGGTAIEQALANPQVAARFTEAERSRLRDIQQAFERRDHDTAADQLVTLHNEFVDRYGPGDNRTNWASRLFRHADAQRSETSRRNVEYWRSSSTGKIERQQIDRAARARRLREIERAAEREAEREQREQERILLRQRTAPLSSHERERRRRDPERGRRIAAAERQGKNTPWQASTSLGRYTETRRLGGTTLRIDVTPNGTYRYYVDGRYAGWARTLDQARRNAEGLA